MGRGPLKLHAQVSGQGDPLVLLHGLFGSLGNLGALARALASGCEVHNLDLRNHGRSPHSDWMDYPAMAADVLAYMDRAGLSSANLLGHSMGGKVAMELALGEPERARRLIVADIAPVAYPSRHDAILEALTALDTRALSSRREADRKLAGQVPEPAVRQFLLKNLVREDGGFGWRMNLEAIRRSYDELRAAPTSQGPFTGPVLFIKGGNSDYIRPDHAQAVGRLFPRAILRELPGAGHWLHAEKPELFATLCQRFLTGKMD